MACAWTRPVSRASLTPAPLTQALAGWALQAGLVISALIIAGAQPDLRSVVALTVAAIALAFAATAALAVPPQSARTVSIGARRATPIAPRHCDPDAAGRPRPRAPSAV